MTETEQPPAARERAGGRVVLVVIAGLLLLTGGIYVAAYLAAGDKVPRGTTVSGVRIGGLTEAEAGDKLREGLFDRVSQPIQVTLDGKPAELDPDDAGLSVDYDASVAEAGANRSWDPTWLWAYFTGGSELEAVVDVDDTALDTSLDRLDEQLGAEPRNGRVAFRSGRVRVTDARAGLAIDRDAVTDELAAAYLSGEELDLPTVEREPEITEADVDTAVEQIANPAMSGSVTLTFGNRDVQLRPRQIGRALSLEPEDGSLQATVDGKELADLVKGGIGANAADPVDATVALVDGKPKVVPGKTGVTFTDEDVEAAFVKAVTGGDNARKVKVASTVTKPEFTAADARKLGIKEKVSEFTTYYPHADYRNTNIGRAAELIDGTVLKPGDTFSLNDTVGERTAANGFVEGFMISNGIFKEDFGGGVSQMATTTYNAAFFAGLKDIEHKPHSFYIDRYPVGREATVAWGSVDLKFENDTPYGVLIHATVQPSTYSSSGVVTVQMYSTKYWDITIKTGNRYNFTSPATRTLDTEDCYPNEGYGGFDVDFYRYFSKAGTDKVVKTEKYSTTYIPSDTVICEEPKG